MNRVAVFGNAAGGKTTLSVRATKKPNLAVMNLASIRLKPVK